MDSIRRNNSGFAMKAAVGGIAAVAVVASLGLGADARAAKKKEPSGFLPTTANVGGASNVPGNAIIEVAFSASVDPRSVTPATFFVREKHATANQYTKQIPGSFQVVSNLVRFFPRLPTHLRDPLTGTFFGEGTPLDNASSNAALKPGKDYELRTIGRPHVTTIRSLRNKPLRGTYFARFSTADATSAETQFTTSTYSDSPPPQMAFQNPTDVYPTALTQYITHGGAKGVQNDVQLQIYGTKVPLAPNSTRVQGNVELTLVERGGSTAVRRPVPGAVFLEQNFETTLLVFKPRFPLADQGVYSLRITKNVRDLTEQFDFEPNRQRLRLRQIYDHFAGERAKNPSTPTALLKEPDAALIADWPDDAASRGVLKTNILSLGDRYLDEVDPRTMILFTTRDEPVSDAELIINFNKSENLFDASLSSAEWDQGVLGAASAIFTIAGGSAVNGDFTPAGNTTLNIDTFANRTTNWRQMKIPSGVVVTVTGTRPATLKCIELQIDGELRADGGIGGAAFTGTYFAFATPPAQVKGGLGGPGGGQGGDENTGYTASGYNGVGGAGRPGVDIAGVPAAIGDGGQGGLGGTMGTGTAYCMGGSGGGGGARTAGAPGASSTPPSTSATYAAWSGTGGAGGAGSANDDLTPGPYGGGGGAAGGNGEYRSQGWAKAGASGGGGGGALTVQTAKDFTMGSTGVIRSRGGVGGNGGGSPQTISGGNGGGGGGGTILMRTASGYRISNPGTATDVRGGAGGTQSGSYVSPNGGAGGNGYVRAEDPFGGIGITNGSQGVFDPIGGGVPSYVYSLWTDLGVQDPKIVPWTNADIETKPTSNDAILVEAQMTRESTVVFDTPNTSALNALQNSTDLKITSNWLPIKIHDKTGLPGGAFKPAGWSPGSDGTEFSGFKIDALNGQGYRFIRFRIYFQLDDLHRRSDPTPNIDRLTTHFQFNL